MNKLDDYLRTIHPLSDASLAHMTKAFQPAEFKRKEIITYEGRRRSTCISFWKEFSALTTSKRVKSMELLLPTLPPFQAFPNLLSPNPSPVIS